MTALILGLILPGAFLILFAVGHYAFGRPAAPQTEVRRG